MHLLTHSLGEERTVSDMSLAEKKITEVNTSIVSQHRQLLNYPIFSYREQGERSSEHRKFSEHIRPSKLYIACTFR